MSKQLQKRKVAVCENSKLPQIWEAFLHIKKMGVWGTLRSCRCLYSVVLHVYISINIYRYIYRGWTLWKPNLAVGSIAVLRKASRLKAIRETGFCPTLAQPLVLIWICLAEQMSDSLDIQTE